MALPITDQAKQPDKRQGTGFTNLQNLMSANKNNRLGQAVGTGVQGQFNQAKDTLGQSQNQFNTDIGNAKQSFDTNKKAVTNTLGNVASGSDQNVNTFNTVLGGQYTGPTALANQDVIASRAQSANQLGGLGATEGGRVELLKRFAGGPHYTSGQSKLDSVLLGQGGNDVLTGLRRDSANLGAQANQAITGAQEQGKELAGQTQQLATDTLDNLQSQYTNLLGNSQTGDKGVIQRQIDDIAAKRQQALVNAQQQLNNNFKTEANTGNLLGAPITSFGSQRFGNGTIKGLTTPEDYANHYGVKIDPSLLQKAGLNSGQSLWGANISDLLTADQTQGNLINASTKEQAAQLLALSKLAGSHFDPSQTAQIAKYNDNADIGTYGNAPEYQMTDAARAVANNRITQAQKDAQKYYDQAKLWQPNVLFNRDPKTGGTANWNVGSAVADLLNKYYAAQGNQILPNDPAHNGGNVDTVIKPKAGLGSL